DHGDETAAGLAREPVDLAFGDAPRRRRPRAPERGRLGVLRGLAGSRIGLGHLHVQPNRLAEELEHLARPLAQQALRLGLAVALEESRELRRDRELERIQLRVAD